MGIIAWIILGLFAGTIARAVIPGRTEPGGCIGTTAIGILGALLATGMDPLRAAASAAWLHADAARRGPASGLVAGDIVDALPGVLATLG